MTNGRDGAIGGQIRRLWAGGTVAGLAEGQVLGRFAADRDPAAFEALVDRHGPMVLGVCRRYLRDPHDAEDAFQATFVILARKAGRLRDRDALGPWLFGVARRVAARARADSARRRLRESPDAGAVAAAVAPESGGPELGWLLDEEIARLPEVLRLPVVLCLIEGLTYDEAAGQLRWTDGMVRGRLARARARLRDRLASRGVAPDSADRKTLSLPPGLAGATLRVVTSSMSKAGAAASAVALADRMMRAWLMAKIGVAAMVAIAAAVVLGAGSMMASPPGRDRAEAKPVVAPARVTTPPAQGEIPSRTAGPRRLGDGSVAHPVTIEGRARDAEGNPVAGAAIFVTNANRSWSGDRVLGRAVSGADGRFALRDVPLPVLPPEPGPIPRPAEGRFEVAGSAPGLAFTWHAIQSYRPGPRPAEPKDGSRPGQVAFEGDPIVADLTFGPPARIRGRVVDDRGRPVAGATVQAGYVDNDRQMAGYGNWLCAALGPDGEDTSPFNGVGSLPEARRSARTDADGRYAIEGLPREARLLARIDGGPISEAKTLTIATSARKVEGATSLGYDGTLGHTLVLPRTVRIMVRHSDTGRPAPGVTVLAQGERPRRAGAIATTDAEGRATLSLPPGPHTLRAEPPGDAPDLVAERPFAVAADSPDQAAEMVLSPGAVVELEAVDAESGAGLAGASFASAPDGSAEHREVQSRAGFVDHPKTDASGRLRAVMPPGRWRFFADRAPEGYDIATGDGPTLGLEPGRPAFARFAFRKRPGAVADGRSPEADEVGRRLLGLWQDQARRFARGRLRGTRVALVGGEIPPDRLRQLLGSLDPDKVPPLVSLIRERFPEASVPEPETIELVADGPRGRERKFLRVGDRLVLNDTNVDNGWETAAYSAANAQVNIGDGGPKSGTRLAVERPSNFCHRPAWVGKVVERAGGRVTLERKLQVGTHRVVADEATGFAYRDATVDAASDSGEEYWQFAPRSAGEGVVVPGLGVEFRYDKGKTYIVWIRTIESIDLDAPTSPGEFALAVPPGTQIRDYREGRDDTYRGVTRRPVTDVVAYADADPRRFKPFVRPIKPGDAAPAIVPAAWIDRSGANAAPTLAGKVVLVDFWGIGCGPCVAQLPEVREAVAHFAGTDLVILGLHDSSGTAAEVAAFAARRGLSWPLAIDRPGEGFGATFEAFGVRSIPDAAVIGRDGRIAFLGRFPEALARAADLLKED